MHRACLFIISVPLLLLAVSQTLLPEFFLLEPLVYILLYAYGGIFLLLGIFLRRIPKPVHIVLAAGCGIGTLLMLTVCLAPLFPYAAPQGDEQAVIVLGASEKTLLASSRTDCANGYLAGHPDVPVLLCGCNGEAESMAEHIQGGHILLETESTNTLENLRNAAKLLSENGMQRSDPLVIVTNRFHLLRLKLYTKKEGFGHVRFLLAETPLRCAPVWVFREAVLLVRYALLGV